MQLGKLPPKIDRRTLRMTSYLIPDELPPIPQAMHWSLPVREWPMFANDHLGDCTIAAAGHMIQTWTAAQGRETVLPDSAIIRAYSAVSGYDPKTGAGDYGAYELDVLNCWRTVGIGGHKIDAFVGLDEKNHLHIKAAIYLFGGAYIGLALPKSAQSQRVWHPIGSGKDTIPGSWGGHAVPVVDYVQDGLVCVTWGELQLMTWSFWSLYADESYAVMSSDFLRGGKSPHGFDRDSLLADLKRITA
jgi:hypothetical protein